MSTKLVITGMGMVTPIGIGIDAYWENLIAGKICRRVQRVRCEGIHAEKAVQRNGPFHADGIRSSEPGYRRLRWYR